MSYSCVHVRRFKDPDEFISYARIFFKNYKDVHSLLTLETSPASASNTKWCTPSLNRLKINVDVAFGSIGAVGAGAIIQDHQGTVCATFALPRFGSFKADVGKVFTIRELLFAVVEASFSLHQVESDPLLAIQYMNNLT
ncbi:hypothetical protein ACOSQ3_004252 [Xanthoceras sorbifolium]